MITAETFSKWKDIMMVSFDRTDRFIKAQGQEESKNKSQIDAKIEKVFFDDLKSLFNLLRSKIGE